MKLARDDERPRVKYAYRPTGCVLPEGQICCHRHLLAPHHESPFGIVEDKRERGEAVWVWRDGVVESQAADVHSRPASGIRHERSLQLHGSKGIAEDRQRLADQDESASQRDIVAQPRVRLTCPPKADAAGVAILR